MRVQLPQLAPIFSESDMALSKQQEVALQSLAIRDANSLILAHHQCASASIAVATVGAVTSIIYGNLCRRLEHSTTPPLVNAAELVASLDAFMAEESRQFRESFPDDQDE